MIQTAVAKWQSPEFQNCTIRSPACRWLRYVHTLYNSSRRNLWHWEHHNITPTLYIDNVTATLLHHPSLFYHKINESGTWKSREKNRAETNHSNKNADNVARHRGQITRWPGALRRRQNRWWRREGARPPNKTTSLTYFAPVLERASARHRLCAGCGAHARWRGDPVPLELTEQLIGRRRGAGEWCSALEHRISSNTWVYSEMCLQTSFNWYLSRYSVPCYGDTFTFAAVIVNRWLMTLGPFHTIMLECNALIVASPAYISIYLY